MPGIPSFSAIPSPGPAIMGNPLSQIGGALANAPLEAAKTQVQMQAAGQAMLAPLQTQLGADPSLATNPEFVNKYTALSRAYGIPVPRNAAGALDLEAAMGIQKKSVSQLSPQELNYYYSMPSGAPRKQAAEGQGLIGISDAFINAPRMAQGPQERELFERQLFDIQSGVSSGKYSLGAYTKFINSHHDELSWTGQSPQELLSDPGMITQQSNLLQMKAKALQNAGLIDAARMNGINAAIQQKGSLANLENAQAQFLGVKAENYPTYMQTMVDRASAALQNSNSQRMNVQSLIQTRVNDVVLRQGALDNRLLHDGVTQAVKAVRDQLTSDQTVYNQLQQNFRAATSGGNSDPSDLPAGQDAQGNPIPLWKAIQDAKAAVEKDHQQLIQVSNPSIFKTRQPISGVNAPQQQQQSPSSQPLGPAPQGAYEGATVQGPNGETGIVHNGMVYPQ